VSTADVDEIRLYLREKVVPFLKAIAAPSWVPVLIPLLVARAHADLLRRWVIDDAGITFSYARNLAHGYGLVSQPGLPPVEGYSNFLWMIAYTPFFLLHRFDALGTPKLLSWLFIIASFIAARRLFRRYGDENGGITFVVLMLLAMNTSFVAWCVSGLENPLYVFLLVLLAWQSLEAVSGARPGLWRSVALGVLAVAVAMTRPEGVLFLLAYPLILLIGQLYRSRVAGGTRPGDIDRRPAKPVALSLLTYILAAVVCLGGFLAFRLSYFHELLPNTYFAKMEPIRSAEDLFESPEGPPAYRLLDVAGSMVSSRLWSMEEKLPAITPPNLLDSSPERRSLLFAVLLVLVTGYLVVSRRFQRAHLVLLVCLAIATIAYLALPPDWMEEYRYATVFFVFLYAYAVIAVMEVVRSLTVQPSARLGIAVALAVIAVGLTRSVYGPRARAFAANPTVPLSGVREWLSDRFDGYAEALGIEHGSLLVPDLGATLFYSKLRVYDLGMLCDKTIAHTMGKDQPAFYHYIFEVAKPTFIHTHGSWSLRANLDGDPRFRRDYVPIVEHPDEWASGQAEREIWSGDYVRKDAVIGKEQIVEQLGADYSWGGDGAGAGSGQDQTQGGLRGRGRGGRRDLRRRARQRAEEGAYP